ncbi:hypothetical protein KPC83_01785 [Collinsella sp. zg1085]|uniref:hypothetical protein n=1 Tax=Collinsella sp. zg1085 TaxID=2844380 RepID=UPI001C0E27A9|nr:hypothetical protein [Collinsella sp. zg1085]QWT17906.1 hypothetical protein KPC83_01785 [Collinsella sp. zg1085]
MSEQPGSLSQIRNAISAWTIRLVDWFLGDSMSASIAWAVALVSLIALLVWFFIISPYGVPAAPVYAEF